MSKLTLRGHVLEPLLDIRRDFDHVLDHIFRHHTVPALSADALAVIPPIETWVDESDKEFHLTMALPGLTPEEVNVHIQGNTLILTGEQKKKPRIPARRSFNARSPRRVFDAPSLCQMELMPISSRLH